MVLLLLWVVVVEALQLSSTTCGSGPPRVVLIHGTFHDQRCFEEHWLPYLADNGVEATAVSLRGTRGTSLGKVRLGEHVADVAEFLPAIVVGHSFGGPVAMELARLRPREVRGLALFCSVPPSGNSGMTWRTLRRSLGEAVLITRGFALKTAAKNSRDAKRLFFSNENVDDDELERYVSWFRDNAASSLDLRDFQRNLPSRFADENGVATFLNRTMPRLVVGAQNDLVVDEVAVRETAQFLGVDPLIVPDVPHDLMLGARWRPGCDALLAWISASSMR
ncbi:hypothetical protein CTAYLR_007329 [Chrysophaeum taylorii]|uniref:AB hydrolase-1 domain-containing protein n=1 Tax=Chrysophaeum taylorii TaxID=2483200 RepID=A0AAD7UJ96_9STRA|nr:hypothetical protein CTAYLR_007329 [Chrysophaeum taylorii]